MCLTIRNFKTRKEAREFVKNPKVAKEDITVYKVIYLNGTARYMGFKYEKGFHYYQIGNKPFSFNIFQSLFDNWTVQIGVGLHSCKEGKTWMHECDQTKTVKMIIPKGAKYFENESEYVSDQLIWY